MTKFQRITRTSLFARMSLLFGLLVTVPLVISGIVLSLAGWQVVSQSGRDVARIGSETLDKTSTHFTEVTEAELKRAAGEVAALGQQRVEETSETALKIGRKNFKEKTQSMTEAGQKAVTDATGTMLSVAEKKLEASLEQLKESNKGSLGELKQTFSQKMTTRLQESTQQLRESLWVDFFRTWRLSADRRALSIHDYAQGQINQLVGSLRLPLRLQSVLDGSDPARARQDLQKYVGKSSTNIIRVVLVSPTGTEVTRTTEAEAAPGDVEWDKPNTPESHTRDTLAAVKRSYITEPPRRDEKTGDWMFRLAHKVASDPSAEAATPTDEATMMTMDGPRYTGFVVVDYKLTNLIDDATVALEANATLADEANSGLKALVIQASTGLVVASKDAAEVNNPANAIWQELEHENPTRYAKAYLPLTYTTADGTRMHAVARYWPEEKCWAVVAQSEEMVRDPVRKLERDISRAWKASLEDVNTAGGKVILERDAEAGRNKNALIAAARVQMAARGKQVNEGVQKSLDRSQLKLSKDLEAELNSEARNLGVKAGDSMVKQAMLRAGKADRAVKEVARTATAGASREISDRARQVANRAARQMLANSTWLIPLFLVLALFLATLTARSLVRPINQLVRGTQALAAGDYHQRIEVRGDDELSRLALAFNHMSGAVEQGQAELQQSHGNLAAEKARIEGIVASSPDGLVMLEPTGQVGVLNPAAMRLLDLASEEVPVAPFAVSQLPAPAAQRLAECLERAQLGEGVQEYEISEPERRVLQLRKVELCCLDQGHFYGRLLHIHDITHERVVDEMKSDFISLVSHELRTPLTSILGFSSYMLTGRLGEVSETQRTALDSIHRQAKRLSAIISDFLDVSRIESGKIEMKKEPIKVPQIASRVVQDLKPQASEKSIRVAAQVEEGPYPLVALGDEQRIAQVFTNLVGNALKFTDHGAVDIVLSRQNGELLCKVRDTGCGIPPDELERVFDRFYQVEKVVTRKSGGTGLGLAIVKNIVEAHGGRIWIDSELGKGTEVTFTLPGSG